ncbi:uncharacterized protein TNCV_3402761 [Trichonephila clavipes]|nr:uncharacterized protein TNCV_3402761 [Trichonephila clavipes]
MNFCQQIPHIGKHLRSGPSLKWNRVPPGFLTSCGQIKLISRFMVTVNSHNCRIWATSNPRKYTQKPLHSPKVTAWCGFTGSFIVGPFFETQCLVNGWITETVNAQRYLTLLRETVVPCLIQRADFWLWGYLKSCVYLSGPSSLSELKDAILREVSSIHPDMLHSAVAGFVTRLECLLPCGGGHVEHILE